MSRLSLVIIIILVSSIIILIFHGCIFSKTKCMYSMLSKVLCKNYQSIFLLLLKNFVLTMLWSLFKKIFKFIVPPWKFYIKRHVLTHHDKIVLQRENTNIFSMLLASLYCRWISLNICDHIVVLTTTYPINKMSSTALAGALPLTKLCPNTPLFHLPPKVFECSTFV